MRRVLRRRSRRSDYDLGSSRVEEEEEEEFVCGPRPNHRDENNDRLEMRFDDDKKGESCGRPGVVGDRVGDWSGKRGPTLGNSLRRHPMRPSAVSLGLRLARIRAWDQ